MFHEFVEKIVNRPPIVVRDGWDWWFGKEEEFTLTLQGKGAGVLISGLTMSGETEEIGVFAYGSNHVVWFVMQQTNDQIQFLGDVLEALRIAKKAVEATNIQFLIEYWASSRAYAMYCFEGQEYSIVQRR